MEKKIQQKKCIVCNKKFVPDKWHPNQKVCFNDSCKVEHRKELLKKWRSKYSDYFLNRTDNLELMRKWRKDNPLYYKNYRKGNLKIRIKNREYVSAYRAREKARILEE
jgi:hypothetical protein